jgi:glycosyltransferase involved in cell wall biosynthesis
MKAAVKYLLGSLHLLEPALRVRSKVYRAVEPTFLLKFAANRFVARKAVARKISRLDNRAIPPGRAEIRAFMIVRNESLRLPFMLRHYFDRGVDRIFVLDNDSSDDTRAIVLSFDNTHLFYTKDIYLHQGAWADLLLWRYGVGHWCLVVDADEMIVYPDFESVSLRQLCNFLDRESFDALDCVMLDMYPDRPLTEIKYIQGTDPLQMGAWFDKSSYIEFGAGPWYCHEWKILHQGPVRLAGGVRKRLFDVAPCVSKVPLVKFRRKIALSTATHLIQGARVADLRGALLHFKFLDDFAHKLRRDIEIEKDWHHSHAAENKAYRANLNQNPNLNFMSPISEKFASSSQLVRLGIMKTSSKFVEYKMSLQ